MASEPMTEVSCKAFNTEQKVVTAQVPGHWSFFMTMKSKKAEWERWLKDSENHVPCACSPDSTGKHWSSKTSSSSSAEKPYRVTSGRVQEKLTSRDMLPGPWPSRRGEQMPAEQMVMHQRVTDFTKEEMLNFEGLHVELGLTCIRRVGHAGQRSEEEGPVVLVSRRLIEIEVSRSGPRPAGKEEHEAMSNGKGKSPGAAGGLYQETH